MYVSKISRQRNINNFLLYKYLVSTKINFNFVQIFFNETKYEEFQLIFFEKKRIQKNKNSITNSIILKTKTLTHSTRHGQRDKHFPKKKVNTFFTPPLSKNIFSKINIPHSRILIFNAFHIKPPSLVSSFSRHSLYNVVKLIEFPNESQRSCKTSRRNSS